jgi:CBS-domain-containing membrane protein
MNPGGTSTSATLKLPARTVAELMTRNPLSLRESATIGEALTFLADHGISGAPVIDAAGRAIGVLTDSDVTVHARERLSSSAATTDDPSFVRDIMTPTVFTLRPEAPAVALIEHLRTLNVHRIFVVDEAGLLVGVVTALDVLRHLELTG